MDKILGLEYQLLILDEGPLFPEEMFHKCYGSVRNANDNGFIATVLITGNPGGISHNYFKTRFIKPEYDKWNPGELKEKDKYKFIQAKVADNPKLGKEYTDKLEALPEHLRRAWLEGDWDVFEGQFFDMWDPRVHVVKEFDIPEHWQKWAGMDLGYTEKHPTVVEWFAQDPITLDVYMYNEWVSQPKGSVEEYTEQLKDIGAMNTRIPIYADPSMWNSTTKTNSSQESPAMLMMREGLPLLIAENNRLNGWRIMKEWLHWGNNKMPKLYVFNCCQMFIETVGRLQYNRNTSDITKVEDLDTKGPDDAVDAVRYALATCGIPCPTHNNKDENTKYQEMLKVQVLDYDPHYERYGEIEIPQIDYSYFEDVGSYF
jgi:phage terminase large subunit